jgi:hypothetical protein
MQNCEAETTTTTKVCSTDFLMDRLHRLLTRNFFVAPHITHRVIYQCCTTVQCLPAHNGAADSTTASLPDTAQPLRVTSHGVCKGIERKKSTPHHRPPVVRLGSARLANPRHLLVYNDSF